MMYLQSFERGAATIQSNAGCLLLLVFFVFFLFFLLSSEEGEGWRDRMRTALL